MAESKSLNTAAKEALNLAYKLVKMRGPKSAKELTHGVKGQALIFRDAIASAVAEKTEPADVYLEVQMLAALCIELLAMWPGKHKPKKEGSA